MIQVSELLPNESRLLTKKERIVMAQNEVKYAGGEQEARIDNNFKYHPPTEDQRERYEIIRERARQLAIIASQNTPASREQSLGFTKLEEAVMWFNAAIARNE